MSATETTPETKRAQPGDDLAHWCASHLYDHQCDANPEACRAFCGYDFGGVNDWDYGKGRDCLVCDEMLDARGDADLPVCQCPTCERIGGAV